MRIGQIGRMSRIFIGLIRAYPLNSPDPHSIPFDVDDKACQMIYATCVKDEYTKVVLYAKAVAANKSVSALVRDWLDERLDLPVPA